MGLFDKSSSSNTTNLVDQTTTLTSQRDLSGNSGMNFSDVAGAVGLEFNTSDSLALSSADSHDVFDSRSSTTYTTDQGAVGAGLELGLSGIKTAWDALTSFGKVNADSLSAIQRVNADSLSLLAGLASDSIDASRTLARDSASSNATFLQDAVAGFGSLAKQTSEGSDDKIARVVGFALAAVAAVVILPVIFKGGGKAVLV